jgi:hypothetical protein
VFKLSIIPREKKFFVLFEQGTQNALKIAQQLKDMVHISYRLGMDFNYSCSSYVSWRYLFLAQNDRFQMEKYFHQFQGCYMNDQS